MKNKNDISVMLKEAGILFAITLISGLLLGVVNELTKEPIRIQQEKAVQEACRAVFASAASFEEMEYTQYGRTGRTVRHGGKAGNRV